MRLSYRHWLCVRAVIYNQHKRKVIALVIELDEMGKGLIDWKVVEYTFVIYNKKSLYVSDRLAYRDWKWWL